MTGSLESIYADPRKKIAIIGKAPSSLGLAPYADESWQIWTLADLVVCKQAPRFDVHFELHDLDQLAAPVKKPYGDWMKSVTDRPIIMREALPDIPASIAFPKDEIVTKYGRYFTNTVSWMLALAIDTMPDEIGVWGVDMATNEEYGHQRPSCEFFLGWAAGAGIKVFVPPQADLLKSVGLYGLDHWQGEMYVKWKARCAELAKRKADAEVRRDQAAAEAIYFDGALSDNKDYWGQWAERT